MVIDGGALGDHADREQRRGHREESSKNKPLGAHARNAAPSRRLEVKRLTSTRLEAAQCPHDAHHHRDHRPAAIACSLTAAAYRKRVADTGQVARDALLERQPINGGTRLSFDDTPGVRERLEAFVAAESECCPFLRMNLRTGDLRLVLEVTGPELAAAIIEELFA